MTTILTLLTAALAVWLAALLVAATVMVRRPARRHGPDDSPPGIG